TVYSVDSGPSGRSGPSPSGDPPAASRPNGTVSSKWTYGRVPPRSRRVSRTSKGRPAQRLVTRPRSPRTWPFGVRSPPTQRRRRWGEEVEKQSFQGEPEQQGQGHQGHHRRGDQHADDQHGHQHGQKPPGTGREHGSNKR